MYGGRWNEPGTSVAYTAGSRLVAALEQMVHLNPSRLPNDYVAYAVEVPNSLAMRRIAAEELPDAWNRRADVPALRRMGER